MKNKYNVKWIRKVRQLTNEKIINLPKELDFLNAGDTVAVSFDGKKIEIQMLKNMHEIEVSQQDEEPSNGGNELVQE